MSRSITGDTPGDHPRDFVILRRNPAVNDVQNASSRYTLESFFPSSRAQQLKGLISKWPKGRIY